MSDISRTEREARLFLIYAAEDLAEALEAVRDKVFGYTPQTLALVNDAFKKAGVQLVFVDRRCTFESCGKPTFAVSPNRCREHLTRR